MDRAAGDEMAPDGPPLSPRRASVDSRTRPALAGGAGSSDAGDEWGEAGLCRCRTASGRPGAAGAAAEPPYGDGGEEANVGLQRRRSEAEG